LISDAQTGNKETFAYKLLLTHKNSQKMTVYENKTNCAWEETELNKGCVLYRDDLFYYVPNEKNIN
jgi:hypothetical protein